MNKSRNEDTIKLILKDIRPDIELEEDTNLIQENIIDSVDVIEIVVNLEKHFSINIRPESIEPKHFQSINSLTSLVDQYINDKTVH